MESAKPSPFNAILHFGCASPIQQVELGRSSGGELPPTPSGGGNGPPLALEQWRTGRGPVGVWQGRSGKVWQGGHGRVG